jgi:pyruvate/2-oxoglutarate dehydrogenase complex dihydrolipoamide dehydrogenase (E3) component/uncharacterized membrane protein YdjX (TVP38/TMEM64 family)
MNKLFLISVVVVIIVAFSLSGGMEYLTLESLKASQIHLAQLYEQSPWLVLSVFFLFYVGVTALSLPGAAILTLAAGALFGLGTGLVLVSFASSIGATVAFLVARYLARDAIEKCFPTQLKTINAGITKEGSLYLLTLRLVPLVPFFLINLLMGLTQMRVRTFYWVSQLGMLLGTVVYVNAGTQLSKIQSLNQIVSPALVISLALLALFPWLAKSALGYWQRRKAYQGWLRPSVFDRNLIVIGGGAAGLVSSYIAATVKAKVTLIEAHKLGGDCLNYGCVPSKALIKSAKVAQQIRTAQKYGVQASVAVDFKAVMQRVREVIQAIEPHDSVERYTKLGIEVVQGYAHFKDPWTIEVTLNNQSTQTLTARNIILATGASPIVPNVRGIENSGYVTSDTLWEYLERCEQVPDNVVIVGGGAIGCELAQALQRLGANVTLVEKGERLLARDDSEVAAFIKDQLEQEGVRVLTQSTWLSCQQNPEYSISIHYQNQVLQLRYDLLICALGRKPRLTGLGLEQLNIDTTKPLEINEYLQTQYSHIYVAGDVVGDMQFTHVAAHYAWYASVNSLFGMFKRFKVDRRVIPRVMFTDPEVAHVGLTETVAQAQGIAYEVTRYELNELDRAITEGHREGFIKVLTVPHKDKILGVTIVGAYAGEILSEWVLAMRQGIGLTNVLSTIHAYPTWGEASKYVAGEWKRQHVLRWLFKYSEQLHEWLRG